MLQLVEWRRRGQQRVLLRSRIRRVLGILLGLGVFVVGLLVLVRLVFGHGILLVRLVVRNRVFLLRFVVRYRVLLVRLDVQLFVGRVHEDLVALLLKKKGTRKSSPWWQRAAPEARTFEEVVDPVIEATPEEDRAALAAIWQKRAGLEVCVGSTFASLSVELFEFGATQTVCEIVSQAVRDEVHHAQISAELAAKYRGGAPVWPEPEPNPIPGFRGAKGALHATLYIVVQCCINETTACSMLEASIAQNESPLVKAGLSRILSDEIVHARAGWAHLASPWVTAEMKRELPSWLEWLHSSNSHDLVGDDAPLPREKYPTHGMLSRRRAREVTYATLIDVIFPGYRAVGVDPSAAEAWARGVFARELAAAV